VDSQGSFCSKKKKKKKRNHGPLGIENWMVQIRSLQPKHVCGRKYKNSIVNSTWITDKLIDKFKVQPNMPMDVIQNEVKN
jgi:hypothetical protein